MQKQQYLQGFLQKTCKNSSIYKVFCNAHAKTAIFTRFAATSIQKHQYLSGFLQRTCKNSNIYDSKAKDPKAKDFRAKDSKAKDLEPQIPKLKIL